MSLTAPVPLADGHELAAFHCGLASLDDWLKRRARANHAAGASRTYVACDGAMVVGYYALAAGAVRVQEAPGRFRRNTPDPVPVIVLGRLAVDRQWQGRNLGRSLLRDAGLRVLQAADVVGIRGMLVHALSPEARDFYQAMGLDPSPLDPMTLMVTVADLKRAVAG
ncbi:GNAT family N-acetyltransferase [Zavarzinia sp.]|uniref:GNAT family N-acetyltransferase n=1 Tax=Zavarzinia sp. TaxID=2027920 RepID=UPI003BB7996D